MTPPKPRRYDGPVEWLDAARLVAQDWDEDTLARVANLFPYPERSGVRLQDWVRLVAHTSTTRPEEPLAAAERLASYVTARAEQTNHHPTPRTIQENQT